MKKVLFITCWIWTICMGAFAQESNKILKIAVFDPSVSGKTLDEGIRITVREIISSAFVNYSNKYSIVERSLLDKIMQEAAFSNTDAVDESQATQLGKLAGADKVVLSILTQAGEKHNMLSIKLIDVQTATVEKQKAKVIISSALLESIEPLTLSLLGQVPVPKQQSNITTEQKKTFTPIHKNPTKSSKEQKSAALVHSVKSFIQRDLEEKVNRYRTDEEKLKHVKAIGNLKELIQFAAKYITNVPNANNNEVTFFCPGNDQKQLFFTNDSPLFLFIDGELIGVGTIEKGLDGIMLNDGKRHFLSVYRNKTKIYSETIDFSTKTEYIFIHEKEIHL